MVSSISFNPYVQNKYVIDPTVKAQLDALGLNTTGSKDSDLEAILSAKTSQNSNTSSITDQANKASTLMSSQVKSGQQGQPPWFSLMQKLGISPTGSKEGDFAAISAKLSTMQSQATNEADKANVTNLQSEFQSLGGQSNSISNAQAQSNPFDIEQNQTADLNKHFLVTCH